MNTPTRVLIVEDDILAADVIRHEVKKVDMVVVGEAHDGLEAVRLARALHPDVVLMDIRMPQMDGVEAAAHIQAECPTPVVLLTAYDDPAVVTAASQVGVGAYLLKPPEAREIERAVTVARARFADLQRLHQLNADLAAYDRSVSHDLRNALGFLLMSSELLIEVGQELSAGDLALLTQQMNGMAQRGLNVIDSLLWLAQPNHLALMTLDMNQIADDVCAMLRLLNQAQMPTITRVTELPPALGHAGLVERIWDNLITNAIKYSHSPAQIEVGGEVWHDKMVRYWVRDYGDGIPPDAQPQLFDPFFRLASETVRGHGLGLQLVKRIVTQLGGAVSVASSGKPGEGAVFYFTLPRG
jgi:two-component system sensor histidine kinase/response regulator